MWQVSFVGCDDLFWLDSTVSRTAMVLQADSDIYTSLFTVLICYILNISQKASRKYKITIYLVNYFTIYNLQSAHVDKLVC